MYCIDWVDWKYDYHCYPLYWDPAGQEWPHKCRRSYVFPDVKQPIIIVLARIRADITPGTLHTQVQVYSDCQAFTLSL